MYWLFSRIAAVLDPLTSSEYTRSHIFRTASLSISQNMEFGVFEILGHKLAKRVAAVSDPEERELLEYLSATYYQVYECASEGKPVPHHRVDRASRAIAQNYQFLGRDDEALDEQMASHIRSLNELAVEEE